MNFAAIGWISFGAVIALYLAHTVRFWVALEDLRQQPNVIEIGKKSEGQTVISPMHSARGRGAVPERLEVEPSA